MVVYPDAHTLDITGPAEVFDTANRLLSDPEAGYRIEFVSPSAPLVRTSSGVVIQTEPLKVDQEPIDTLVVPGGWGLEDALADQTLVTWISQAAARSRRITSVCGGAFLLAEAELLAGRRATTHWAYCSELARRYPDVIVDPEPIFVWDGPLVTSAGVSTGIDMSLALVEEDHGATLALELARLLALFFKRNGAQSQFSTAVDTQFSNLAPIQDAQEWILANLERPLPVPDIAEHANMSPRNFARVFRREIGVTPALYVEQMRIARARTLLETTELPIKQVARRCGFITVETFFRSFARTLSL
ncbi:MAG: DJ-1/PfpI family protein, partial [Longispora sp.]|nr:DJ-1/PfpI family protein [Longispora sp. (in: high G+C Gram-positive bacteria)]